MHSINNCMDASCFELPAHLGGLGIMNPTKCATIYNNNSLQITAPLTMSSTREEMFPWHQCGTGIHQEARKIRKMESTNRGSKMFTWWTSTKLQRAMDLGSEKGASGWLMTLPFAEHNFALHKGSFRDVLCMWYGWQPSRMPLSLEWTFPLSMPLVVLVVVCPLSDTMTSAAAISSYCYVT